MAVLTEGPQGRVTHVKGAPERVLELCAQQRGQSGDVPLQRDHWHARMEEIAADGMRLLRHYSGSPVCAPSRSVLMTGRHLGHTRVRGNAGSEARIFQRCRRENWMPREDSNLDRRNQNP